MRYTSKNLDVYINSYPCCISAHVNSLSFLWAPVFIGHILQLVPYCCYSLISRPRMGLNLWTSTELHQSNLTHQRNLIHVEGYSSQLICFINSASNVTANLWWYIANMTTCCNKGLEKLQTLSNNNKNVSMLCNLIGPVTPWKMIDWWSFPF